MIGNLTVVGTGMDVFRHLTPEARAAIEFADVVYYCVCDAPAEMFIRTLNKNSEDLYPMYSESIPRYVTYSRMTAKAIDGIKNGYNVCFVFYGHPGVCATSPHAAIAEARKLGAKAIMLPAISSHDALLAEIGIDPGLIGCQIYEATSYLTRDRAYDQNTPLIIYQLGAIGDLNHYENGFPNICVHLLRERLCEQYGPSHKCRLFTAANMPFAENEVIEIDIAEIGVDNILMAHTLYVPPVTEPLRDRKMIDVIHQIRDNYYKLNGLPQKADWPEHSETFDEHPGAKIYQKV